MSAIQTTRQDLDKGVSDPGHLGTPGRRPGRGTRSTTPPNPPRRTLMEEPAVPSKLMDERMGHEDGSVQARYTHVTAGGWRRGEGRGGGEVTRQDSPRLLPRSPQDASQGRSPLRRIRP